MHIINHLCTYAHQTELSVCFAQTMLNNCADRFITVRLVKVDFETDVGLIIVLRRHRTRKFGEFGEITQNRGHYAVQGHSRSPILVPIESSCTTFY